MNACVIVGADDVGNRESQVMASLGLDLGAGEAGFSGDQIRHIHGENVDVRTVPLDRVLEEIQTRTGAGLARLDGVALMSCRPYGKGENLSAIRDAIRQLPETHTAFPSVPARVVPVVLSDVKFAIAGRPLAVVPDPWTGLVPPAVGVSPTDIARSLETLGARTLETWSQCSRNWRLDLIQDLECGGLVVACAPDGTLRPRVALRRKTGGGQMHLKGFNPLEAHTAGLPIFSMDIDPTREPFGAFADLCNDLYKRYARTDRSKGEIVLHRFLDQNPELLRTETYVEYLTETTFAIRRGGHARMRTDLMLRPLRPLESKRMLLVELKTPGAPTYRMGEGDLRLSAALLRAIRQVREYRNRLLDPKNEAEVRRRLEGQLPESYELAVVIGTRPAGETDEIAGRVRTETARHGVQLVRFDELAEFGMRLCGRESPLVSI